jgi:predicted dehydrogenase
VPDHLSRRTFIASTAATLAAAQVASAAKPKPAASKPAATKSASAARRLKVGLIGVGGRGMNHVNEVSAVESAEVVAICDVDARRLAEAARIITAADLYTDFREVIAHKGIEAVLVCTPDHTHATIAAAAMRAGKHVYCEKPLCHTIAECRAIVKLADETRLVTQTGTQMHACENYRRVVEIIQSGGIGAVREVHIWHNRTRRPHSEEVAPVPAELNYDLWLGPQSMRPFKRGYHPYSWRHWWDFGGAQIGDQGSHFLDVVFWALGLTHATKVTARGDAPPNQEIVNNHIIARYEFPARGDQPAVTLNLYDNPAKPYDYSKWKLSKDLAEEAVMFVGDGGMLACNYTEHQLLPEEKFTSFKAPEPSIPKSIGHWREWIEASLSNDPGKALAPFSHGARLAEVVLLGIIAYRTGETLEWDGEAARFRNSPAADKLLGYQYREGWTL